MKNLKLLPVSIAAATTLLGMAPSVTLAQSFTLEEVVVTARKREESLQDVPVSVSNFSADDLAAFNMTSTKDIAAFTPGLHIETNSANNLSSAMTSMRGQVQTDSLSTVDPSVGWYIDDVYLARTYGTVASMFDVERVEVLKGPQGTLYGRNTTGGAIKLVTTKADPSAGVAGFVTGTLGNFGTQKFGGAVNIPLVEDVLAVRLTALKDEVKDGWGSQIITPNAAIPAFGFPGTAAIYPGNPFHDITEHKADTGLKDIEMLRAGVTWNVSDDLTVLASYETVDFYANSILTNFVNQQDSFLAFATTGASKPPGDLYSETKANGAPQSTWLDADTASITVTYDINDDLATKLVWGWRDVESSFWSDVDGTAMPLNWFVTPFQQNAEQTSLEWQLTGSAMNGALDWMTGLYYFEEDGIDFSNSGGIGTYLATIGTGNPSISGTYNATIDRNISRSAFVSGTLHLTDTVNFNGGLRYTRDTKPVSVEGKEFFLDGSTACRFPVDVAPNADPVNCTWSQSASYEYISWTVGFDWQVQDDVLAYIKSSSAQRAGGQNLRGLGPLFIPETDILVVENSFEPFQPEKATDIEIGVKGQYFDNSLQLNAAVYHIWYTDVQKSALLETANGVLSTFISNTSKATYDGLEVEAKWVITDQLMVSGTYGMIDWQYDNPEDLSPNVPDKELTLRVNYLIPASYGTWTLDGNYSFRGEYYPNSSEPKSFLDAAPESQIESVDLFGARVSLELEGTGVSVAAWGRNLTDEEYTLSPLVLGSAAKLYAGGLGEPRSYGVDVTYNF